MKARIHYATSFTYSGLDTEDLKANVYTIDHRLLVGIFGHEIVAEKTKCVFARRSRQADKVSVEVFEHLTPQAVDRTVAFVCNDKVEVLNGDCSVVGNRTQVAIFVSPSFIGRGFFGRLVQFLAP